MERPDYLVSGEAARLFPVLSDTSKEGRTTSITLSCLSHVDAFGKHLLSTVGIKPAKRSRLLAYTEPVFRGVGDGGHWRPDGLLVLRKSNNDWTALVEAKVGSAELDPDQIERYRAIAREQGIDCVITISNQFASSPDNHPVTEVRKSRSRIPVYHWSWMSIVTAAQLLISQERIGDEREIYLIEELLRFLVHESAGIRGFDRMPPEWTAVNKLVSAGGRVSSGSEEASRVVDAWHQEARDVSLILSRLTGTRVSEKVSAKHRSNVDERRKADLALLRDEHVLGTSFEIPDAAAPLVVVADMRRRALEVGMTLNAPEDRKSSKARVNWLLRQVKVKTEDSPEIFVRLIWPGRSQDTLFSLDQLREDASICEEGKSGLQVKRFHVFLARQLGGRFAQQANFVNELESAIPEFYGNVGQGLSVWKKPAPKIAREPDHSDEEEERPPGPPGHLGQREPDHSGEERERGVFRRFFDA